MTIFTPINQVKLTNVSVVRLRKHGKRFEVACYKNKILDWKNNLTTDLDQVLQTDQVFTNVSKGQVAKKEDLSAAFPSFSNKQIIQEILAKGEVQLGEKERTHQLDNSFKDIARIVSEKCINPATQRPYSSAIIEKAMADAHFSINQAKSSKQQALEVIRLIQSKQILPLKRALLKICVKIPNATSNSQLTADVRELATAVEDEQTESKNDTLAMVLTCEPGVYKQLCEIVEMQTCGQGGVATLMLKDVSDE